MNVMQPKDIRTLHPVASSKLSIFSSTQSFKPFPPRFTDLFNPKIITPLFGIAPKSNPARGLHLSMDGSACRIPVTC